MKAPLTRARRHRRSPLSSHLWSLGLAGFLTAGFTLGSITPLHAQPPPPSYPPPMMQPPPPMPAPRVEVVPPVPAPEYVWVPGHWAWRPGLGRYAWISGHYQVPAHATHVWVPAHWAWSPGGYHWIEGYWRYP
jgi:hypothetical protein